MPSKSEMGSELRSSSLALNTDRAGIVRFSETIDRDQLDAVVLIDEENTVVGMVIMENYYQHGLMAGPRANEAGIPEIVREAQRITGTNRVGHLNVRDAKELRETDGLGELGDAINNTPGDKEVLVIRKKI